MKTFVFALFCICFGLCGCGDSRPRESRPPVVERRPAPKVPKRPPTPEEELGIEQPGKLAASVDAWANSNELGEYFRQSRDRLANLHAQLMEDYKVRKESGLEPTDFTNETLRKYHRAFDADSTLRRFMVECYSRKEVLPLPKEIERLFTTASEKREEMRKLLEEGPGELARLKQELDSLKHKFEEMGAVSWAQEKELRVWRDLNGISSEISTKANKVSVQASAMAANMAKVVRFKGGDSDVELLGDEAERLKADSSSFAIRASTAYKIVNGQMLITKFANDCRIMAESMTTIPSAFAKKKARQAEIQELTNRITSSHTRGYGDLSTLSKQAAELKARSKSEGEKETELGKRVQKLAGNYEKLFGATAIYRLKKELPDPSARARIDSCLASFKQSINIPSDTDPSGTFANIESKSYQLADRMEEEAQLKRMDDTLRAVQRLAARKR